VSTLLRHTPCAACGEPSYRYYRKSRRHKAKVPYCLAHLRRVQRHGHPGLAKPRKITPAALQEAADLRLNDPQKWSWRKLGERYGVVFTWIRKLVLDNYEVE
jgi:hypothetical protein